MIKEGKRNKAFIVKPVPRSTLCCESTKEINGMNNISRPQECICNYIQGDRNYRSSPSKNQIYRLFKIKALQTTQFSPYKKIIEKFSIHRKYNNTNTSR